MPGLLDYLRPRRPNPFEPFNSRVTYYAPGPGDRMEGGFETSQPNPQTGQRRPSTLDDVRLGTSPFVTLAGDPSRYGQTVKMGPLTYTSPIDQKSYTVPDVTGYVHDTGSAFRGRPDKLDVAAGDYRGWSPQAASAAVTADAGRRTVTPLSGDEADRAMRPIGMPEPWRATGAGESPTETAIAQGPPPQGRKMPSSLMDMFQPQNVAGEPIGFGDALRGNSNSLVGMGMGLLQPWRPGESPYTAALQGFQAGSVADSNRGYRQAQLAHQKQQEARQAREDAYRREQDARQFGLQERQFARGGEKPPETREVFDPTAGRNVVQEFDPKTRQWGTATMGGGTPMATQGSPAGPGGAPAPQPQPVLPPKKPLTAHEQTAIDKADESLAANQAVIGNLRDAKTLSPKAASGPYALERGQMGQHLPGFLGAGGKETVELHNVVATNAVEQLKAVFGGNPTEGERKILIDLQGSVSASDEVRQKIFDRAIEAAEKRLETNRQKALQIRGGTYYTPSGGAAATPSPPAPAQGPQSAPKPGTVSKGYVFKGGDPSDEKNWAPVR